MKTEDMNVALMVGTLRTPMDEGTGKSVINLAKKLQDRVEKVFVFTRDSNQKNDVLPSEEVYEGVRILRRPIKPLNFFQNRRLMKEEQVDLVHVHTSSAKMALYASKLAHESLWTIPAYRSKDMEENIWQKLSNQKALATSEDLKDKSPADTVLPYGVDTRKYSVDRKTDNEEKVSLLYMGAPNEKRGFYPAIKIIKELRKLGENIEFKVAVRERNNQKQRAKQVIEEKGLLEHTEVRGFIEDLPRFYNSVDFLLNPIKDGSGVTSPPVITLEAMSCGRIACCTRIPDFENLIEDGQSGLLFQCGEEQKMAERISELSQQDIDGISENARDKILEEYSWSYITDEYIQTYGEIVSGS